MRMRALVGAGIVVALLPVVTAPGVGAVGTTSGASPLARGGPAMSTAVSTAVLSAAARPARTRTVWVCRPGMRDNPCRGGLGTTVIAPDGSTTRRPFVRAARPTFDCFYVYPTVSKAKRTNAPRRSAPQVLFATRAQAALFQRECRLFVPAYRQITSAGLASGAFSDPKARRIAQRDIDRAFDDYLARHNDGRPFLLLGHSQGSFVLSEVVRTRIDPSPRLRARLVSVMLIGGGPWLAPGSTTQGTFSNVPPCTDPDQAGCLVAFNTYGDAPPSTGLFGRTVDGRTVVCTNPAALPGGPGLLDPIVPVPDSSGADVVRGFWEFPDSARAQCSRNAAFTWLDVARVPGSQLPQLAVTPTSGPAWGLHRVDVTLALGNLIDLAARQAAAVAR